MEFALIVPVLVMILLFSMYLTELVRAKLKLQEFSRYVVLEMTSYTLSDFANAKHEEAFADAQREIDGGGRRPLQGHGLRGAQRARRQFRGPVLGRDGQGGEQGGRRFIEAGLALGNERRRVRQRNA